MVRTQIGIDIIEINRVQEAVSRWGNRFLHKIYTDAELALCGGRAESLAVRFAGKEAAIKALYRPGTVISWLDIEILAETSGKPLVNLYGQALKQARDLKLGELGISLSHSREYAVALVIGEREDILT